MGKSKENSSASNEQRPEKKVVNLETRSDAMDESLRKRVEALERNSAEVYKAVWDGHKTFITVVFAVGTFVSGFLTYLGRQDVKDANSRLDTQLRHFEDSFRREEENLDKKFAALAGNASKRPALEILSGNGPLDGQVINIHGTGLGYLPLALKNTGEKKTDSLSVSLRCTELLDISPNIWDQVETNEKGFRFGLRLPAAKREELAPGETWNSYRTEFRLSDSSKTNCACNLRVYYGGEKAAEANFSVVVVR